jgi:hypothetical protein
MALTYHKRIRTILSDGEWHTLREIYDAVARFIGSEAADEYYKKRHPDWENEKRAVRIATAKKRLVFLSLNTAIHHAKTVQARGRDWERQYKLTAKAIRAHSEPRKVAKKGGEA